MRAPRRSASLHRDPAPQSDDGYTLIEVIVGTMLIGIVMAGATAFFVNATGITRVQGGEQTAVQLATEAVELARAIPIESLRAARGNAGGRWTPPRPTPQSADPERPVRNGVHYTRRWSISSCWQPPGGGGCGAHTAGFLPFLRVVVAVSWPEQRCSAGTCAFTTSTLISDAARDPVFAP